MIVNRTISLAIPAQDAVEGEGGVLTAKREVTVVEHEDLEQIAGKPN